eukprot:9109707-Alexandrium_andersonii.AAC.1
MHDAVAEWVAQEARPDAAAAGWNTDGDVLSDFELQFARQIKDGPGECFSCRRADCAFIGRHADQAHAMLAGGGRIACPRCGTRFQPWAPASPSRLACDKVWVVRVSDELAHALSHELYDGQFILAPA